MCHQPESILFMREDRRLIYQLTEDKAEKCQPVKKKPCDTRMDFFLFHQVKDLMRSSDRELKLV